MIAEWGDEAVSNDGPTCFVRLWRLYLSSALAAFRAGWLQLFQVVFEDAAAPAVARPRRHLYATPAPAPWRSIA